MKASQWEQFARNYLLRELPGFAVKGRLLYQWPWEHVVTGVYAEQSAFAKEVIMLQALAVPLYVPTEGINFMIGKRFPGDFEPSSGSAYQILSMIKEIALPFVQAHCKPRQLTSISRTGSPPNVRLMEVEAYSLILLGQTDEARHRLKGIIAVRPTLKWEIDIQERAASVLGLLRAGLDVARRQLEQWEIEAVRVLGLP